MGRKESNQSNKQNIQLLSFNNGAKKQFSLHVLTGKFHILKFSSVEVEYGNQVLSKCILFLTLKVPSKNASENVC